MKRPLIIIAGPTATGKSAAAVELAKLINGAVISADSMQIYKGMDIGSAKISEEEKQNIDHYLIDELDPKDEFSVAVFKEMALNAMDIIYSNGQIPIITGGTGFYIQAVLYDIDFKETKENALKRNEYREYAEQYGPEALHERLKEVDPEAAGKIHCNNVKRVIRALEYHEETGEQISEHNRTESAKESPYAFEFFVLTDDRAALYRRINGRVEDMFRLGLTEEVTSLYELGLTEDDISMKGIGYREFFPYFRGEINEKELVSRIKSDTRHFAKRQLTWFRREKDARWIDISLYKRDPGKIAEYMAGIIKKDGLLLSDPEE